ncbi:MAG: hypothetical protein HY902_02770 [Deltaproteobacteria bacterium]|nr:hypothetical protein [Deltaproteobacteria bacterium]
MKSSTRWSKSLHSLVILAAAVYGSACSNTPTNQGNSGFTTDVEQGGDVPIGTFDITGDAGGTDTSGTKPDTTVTEDTTGGDTGTGDTANGDTATTDTASTDTTATDTTTTDTTTEDVTGPCKADTDCPADPNDPCQVGSCTSGVCGFKPAANGGACDDKNACTENDVCNGGTCDGTIKKCDDGNPCTADACDQKTGCTATNTTSQCDDGDACTLADVCADGKCTPGKADTCDDGNPCTDDTCDKTDGCKHGNNTASCEDGNACTGGDACANGACTGGTAIVCDDKNPCTVDACDPKTGCTATAAANGATCDDGDACTASDVCQGGSCVGAAINCDDKNACTKDSCDKQKGCQATNDDTLTCDDGNSCTTGDKCTAGVCKGAGTDCKDDGNPCTDDGCKNGVCEYLANAAPCDDANPCTQMDTCKDKACAAGTPIPCDDKNPCTTDTCDSKSGTCVFTNNTEACNDSSACTDKDTCQNGACVGAPKSCDDNKPCTVDSCDDATGNCTHTNYPDTTACDDSSACTQKDACKAGECLGETLSCDDGNPCTNDTCDKVKGCQYAANTAKCEDGNKCTLDDTCKDKACTAGTNLDKCDDGNVCTDDKCDAQAGCQHNNNTVNCTDSNACTITDVCKDGACAGVAKSCDDNQLCTDDSCDKATGCINKANTLFCTDNSACTTDDVCTGGKCVGKALPPCDDKNPCTTDTCDPQKGCVYTPVKVGTTCDDGNGCTTADACDASGKCLGQGKTCDDNNVCTTDSCANNVCSNVKNTNPCNDGSVCTLTDTCDGKGACVGGNPQKCVDGNICTDDTCDKLKGCAYPNNTLPCDDGMFCTDKDACAGGKCTSAAPKTCDDGNVCTNDSCDAVAKACVNAANTAACDDGDKCTPGDKCSNKTCVAGKAVNCDDLNPCTLDACTKATGACTHALTTDVAVCPVFAIPKWWPIDAADPLWVNAGGNGTVKWATDATAAVPGKLTGSASLNFNNGTNYNVAGQAVAGSGLGKFFVDATAFKGTQMTISFYSWSDVEGIADFDKRFVEFSTDGFVTTALSYQLDNKATQKAWKLEAFDAKALIGKKFQVRFRFDSGDSQSNTGAGWFVDEVNIYGGPIVTVKQGTTQSDSFSNNANGWQTTAANAAGTGWSIDNTPVIPAVNSGDAAPSSLNFNNGKDFAGLAQGWTLAPVIDLTGAAAGAPVILLFKEYFDTETGSSLYDTRHVEVTGDAFVSLPINVNLSTSGSLAKGWHWAWVDLSAVKGKKVHLRFRFDSADDISNGGAGWFIDDAELSQVPAPSYGEMVTCANASAFTFNNFNSVGWGVDNNGGKAFLSGDCSLNVSAANPKIAGQYDFTCPIGASKVGGTAKTAAFSIVASPTAGAKTYLTFKALFDGDSFASADQFWVVVRDTVTNGTTTFLLDKSPIYKKWGTVSLDVSALVGKKVVVEFNFDSVNCSSNAGSAPLWNSSAGIFVEDIMVRADK